MVPAILERKTRSGEKNIHPFSPPEWEVITFPKLPAIDPEVYLRKENINRHGSPYTVTILDEHFHDLGGGTEMIIQWILGHHRQRLPKAYEHQGWQGDEMIRKLYRQKILCDDGSFVYKTKEEDISKEQSINCNRWGRVL